MITHATPDDAGDIARLLNDNIRHGTALWTDETTTPEACAQWIMARQSAGLPVLVARDAAFLGYASYGPYREKEGYRFTVENSVYVAPEAQGRGVARALMEALIDHARQAGMHTMIGAIEAGNTASIALHERLGFRQMGVLSQVGTKFDRWLDLALLQLMLHPDGS